MPADAKAPAAAAPQAPPVAVQPQVAAPQAQTGSQPQADDRPAGAEAQQAAQQAPQSAPAAPDRQPVLAGTQPAHQPAAASAPSAPPLIAPAHLAATIERLHDVIHLQASHASARARLELHPRDLGAVDVVLRSTSAGVTAKITVHDPAALAAVTQAGTDLRNQLEQRGVTVHQLDVALADQNQRRGDDRPSQGTRTTKSAAVASIEDDDELTTSTTTPVPSGALVDVHA